jgi:hypothetical protein
LNELLALRKVLDRYAFTTLWPHRDAAYRAEFTGHNCAIAQAMETGKRTAAIKAEMHFHSFPHEFCGDGTLLEVWQQLAPRVQLCFTVKNSEVETRKSDGASVVQARARRSARSGERRTGGSDQAPPARGDASAPCQLSGQSPTVEPAVRGDAAGPHGRLGSGTDMIPTGGTQ